MKILFLTPWYPDEALPNHGIFIKDQALALTKVTSRTSATFDGQHEVHVISAKVNYQSFGFFSFTTTTEQHGNLTETRLVIKRSLPLFNQLNFFWCLLKVSGKIAYTFQPDIIHSNIGFPGAYWGWRLSKMTGRPWVLSEHTLLHNNFRSLFHKWLTIRFLPRAHAVVTVSQHSAAIIKNLTGYTSQVIPNIIRFDLFSTIHPAPALPVQIGFLGSHFFEKKGLNVLLKALSHIQQDYVLHIGGNEPDLKHYQELAIQYGMDQKCRWHGAVLRDQVPVFFSRLHFFVSASRFESFGMAIAEAMACGLPVVSTDSGGPSDFVTDTNGVLVPVNDPDALKAALGQMMDNWQQYDREQIRKSVIERFDQVTIGKKLESLYSAILKRN